MLGVDPRIESGPSDIIRKRRRRLGFRVWGLGFRVQGSVVSLSCETLAAAAVGVRLTPSKLAPLKPQGGGGSGG